MYLQQVGRLIYAADSFDFDDRLLAHLNVVFMNKLRRRESFMFNISRSEGVGPRSLWMHPSIPVVFHFYGSRQPSLNRHWVEALLREANSANGLTLVEEPAQVEVAIDRRTSNPLTG